MFRGSISDGQFIGAVLLDYSGFMALMCAVYTQRDVLKLAGEGVLRRGQPPEVLLLLLLLLMLLLLTTIRTRAECGVQAVFC
jgi:hypothetical protein